MSHAIAQMYASVEVPPPTASRMTVCYGFVCRLRIHLDFTPADRKALSDILNKGKANAARRTQGAAVRGAMVRPPDGTDPRHRRGAWRAPTIRHRDDDRNYDCYDTTRNAVSLLLVLREWGLLRHHTISDPRYRGT